jgi:hypothetical protein
VILSFPLLERPSDVLPLKLSKQLKPMMSDELKQRQSYDFRLAVKPAGLHHCIKLLG